MKGIWCISEIKMAENYHQDLTLFRLDEFRHILETEEVLPGRKILSEKITERFAVLESQGINNLQDLLNNLKSKNHIEKFATQSGLPVDYLVILRRQVNSYLPKPFTLQEIPGIDPIYINRLAACGIKNSQQIFMRSRTKQERTDLARQVDLPYTAILELFKLSNLARINGVGPVFARLIYETGVDTLEKLVQSAPEELYKKLLSINHQKQYTKIMATLKDLAYCIKIARSLPREEEDDL
jgi:predicted flap endonuclease-1-like 5' DNA nuclease